MLKGQYHTSHLDSFVRDKDLLRGWNIVLLQSTVLCEMLNITTDMASIGKVGWLQLGQGIKEPTSYVHTYIQATYVYTYIEGR